MRFAYLNSVTILFLILMSLTPQITGLLIECFNGTCYKKLPANNCGLCETQLVKGWSLECNRCCRGQKVPASINKKGYQVTGALGLCKKQSWKSPELKCECEVVLKTQNRINFEYSFYGGPIRSLKLRRGRQ